MMMDGCIKFQGIGQKKEMGLCSTVYLFSVTVFTNLCIVSGYSGEFNLFVFSDSMLEEPLRLFTEIYHPPP